MGGEGKEGKGGEGRETRGFGTAYSKFLDPSLGKLIGNRMWTIEWHHCQCAVK